VIFCGVFVCFYKCDNFADVGMEYIVKVCMKSSFVCVEFLEVVVGFALSSDSVGPKVLMETTKMTGLVAGRVKNRFWNAFKMVLIVSWFSGQRKHMSPPNQKSDLARK